MRVRSEKDLKLAMNSAIRKPPRPGITPPAAQNMMRPSAGPKINPQPRPAVAPAKPAVAQTKTIGSAPAKTFGAAQLRRTRVAPPVFRPQLRPTCLQSKTPQLKGNQLSPRMNQPQPNPKAIQTRRTLNHPSKQQSTHKSPAPTVPKVLQTKKAASGPTINAPTRASSIQLRRPDGFYRLRQDANVRALRNYKVIAKLPEGQIVYAKNNHRPSNFKAGTHWYSPTNEHTWVEWDNPADAEYQYLSGWIEDSKLEPAMHILQEQFRPGDKLYGRHETRYSIIRSGEERNATVHKAKFNIIDDVNSEIRSGLTMRSPAEARGFAEFAEGRMQQSAETIRIRKMCKLGLAYVTQDRFIHFMLDGLDPDEIYREAVNTRMVAAAEALGDDVENELPKRCTGAEMRALMRQRLFDSGTPGGKNHGIDLRRVKFYMCYAETPPPWSRQAIPTWRQAWLNYSRYRAERARA